MIGPKVPKPTAAESRAAHDAVSLRSGGMCEGCGRRPKTDRHHRLHGADGRLDHVDNLLDLCGGPSGLPGGNHSGCHGDAHSGRVGYLLGWSVRSGHNPADVPVYQRGRDVFTLRGVPIAHATAAAAFAALGVVPDVGTYLAWFEPMRIEWAREGGGR
jgi:hypothetical protein